MMIPYAYEVGRQAPFFSVYSNMGMAEMQPGKPGLSFNLFSFLFSTAKLNVKEIGKFPVAIF
jgi:hypothetical protein